MWGNFFNSTGKKKRKSHGSEARGFGVETSVCVHDKFRNISFLVWDNFKINQGHVP